MIITELYIDKNTCKIADCKCGENKCYKKFLDLFDTENGNAKVNFNPIPTEYKDQAEWAIFYCWQQDGTCAGSILGRGEPETPEPD